MHVSHQSGVCAVLGLHVLQVTISADDGIRPGATAASLSGLKTVFKRDGTTTAGNSSQVGAVVC